LPISLSRSSRAALIPSIRDPLTTPVSIGAPFPIDKVHCHSSMPPWGLTEISRSKGSYFDCILQICPFGDTDQPWTCALFKLTHYRAGTLRYPRFSRRSRRTHHVCSDRRDEGSKPTRRSVTEGKALGQAQTRARSMKQQARRHEPAPPEYRLVLTFLPSARELTRV
jgi:hypothetical protein